MSEDYKSKYMTSMQNEIDLHDKHEELQRQHIKLQDDHTALLEESIALKVRLLNTDN